ncbi:hypothetical protein COCOBI_02-5880 [Coccomyxa sp. Obi]|nr:hypothetical protein COCOBI_02-5880 [Coccomyxa sp. Obi]
MTVPVANAQKGEFYLQEPDTREALDGTSEGVSEAAPSSNERPSGGQDAQEHGDPLSELRRLSGPGLMNSDPAFARSLMHNQADIAAAGSAANSNQAPAERMGSGGDVVTVPMKRAGSALARDKSGRFIGKSTPAAKTMSKAAGPGGWFRRGCIDPDDPLEQDLMASQAHLFDDAPVRIWADSLNQEGSGEVLSPADRMHASSPTQLHHPHARSALSDAERLAELQQLRSRLASLEHSLLAARLQTLCVMCKAAARSTVARPCGHVLYCVPCMAARVAASGICPECMSPILQTEAVILVSP